MGSDECQKGNCRRGWDEVVAAPSIPSCVTTPQAARDRLDTVKLGLETESCHLGFQQARLDVFEFIELTSELGLDGVQINVIPDRGLHPEWGMLDGDDAGYLRDVHAAIEARGLYCEIDARGTSLSELGPVLRVARALESTLVRSYVRYPGGTFDATFLVAQAEMVRQLIPLLEDYGIRLAFENHEFETSEDMLELVRAVDEPDWVGLLCDVGNSMMAWEEPVRAVKRMAPYTFGAHFKDHAVVMDQDPSTAGAVPVVCGVPLGRGSIDLETVFRILVEESQANTIGLETCFPYCATFKREVGTGGSHSFQGAFSITDPPFPRELIAPMQYYYPSDVGEDACAVLVRRQLEELQSSVDFLTGLRDEHPKG